MEAPAPDAGGPAEAPRPEYLVALFVAVTWASIVFAIDGIVAFVSDRDPIPAGVSPYYGLLAMAAAGVVVWFATARAAAARGPVLVAVAGAAGVYLVLAASGIVGGFGLVAAQATSASTVVAVGAAAVAVTATQLGMSGWRARVRARRRERTDRFGE